MSQLYGLSYAEVVTSTNNENIINAIIAQNSEVNAKPTGSYIFRIRSFTIWSEVAAFNFRVNGKDYIPARDRGDGIFEFNYSDEHLLVAKLEIETSGADIKITYDY